MSAVDIIATELAKQGAAYPFAGASAIVRALNAAGFAVVRVDRGKA